MKHIYERIVAKRVSSTNAKTHKICEHTFTHTTHVSTSTTTITPRDRKEEKERGKNQFSRLFTCLLSNNLLIKLARTRTKFHRGVCVSWCVREKARAQSEWSGARSHRFKIPEPAPKCKNFRVRVKDTRAHARSKRKHESTLFLFLSSSSTSVVAHRVSRVVHSSSLIIKSLFCANTPHQAFYAVCSFSIFFASLSLSRERERLERRKRRRGEQAAPSGKGPPPPKKDLISLISLLITKKKIKENWRSLSAHSPLFCISFF